MTRLEATPTPVAVTSGASHAEIQDNPHQTQEK